MAEFQRTNIFFSLTVAVLAFCLCLLIREIGKISHLNRESEQMFNYINHLEKIMDDTLSNQHEFKNQLISLRGLAAQKEYAALDDYLNKILNTETTTTLRNKNLNAIPIGGLKGLIFMKFLEIEDKQIPIDLIFDEDLRFLSPTQMEASLYYDLCRIVGVLIDNAREAAEISLLPELLIELYAEDPVFKIAITNSSAEIIEIDKLAQAGYTSKETNRGYGLTLVHKLIAKHKSLTLTQSQNDLFFTQCLSIKNKET